MPETATLRTPPSFTGRFPGDLLLRFRRDPAQAFREAGTAARAQGEGVIHIHLGFRQFALVVEPALVGELFTQREDDVIKPPALRASKFILGRGLLTSEGAFHRQQRKLVLPAFHRSRLHAYAEVMAERASAESEVWHDGQTVDVHAAMMRVTLEIVAETLLGADLRGEARGISEAVTAALMMFDRARTPFGMLLNYLPLPGTFRLYAARRRLDATIYRVIRTRRATGRDTGDLLSMLLTAQDEAGARMTDEQVRDEAMTLFLAGHETTAVALTWTLALLAQHPAAEEKLHAEVDALGRRRLGFDDLAALPYTRQVISEGMRLFPPAWSVGRQAVRATRLGNYEIPKGWLVGICQWHLHRDPTLWPEPERFDPERFAPEAQKARPKFAYLPFSVGRRGCIGEQFAWAEAVLVLATLAQRWRFRLIEDALPPTDPGITLRPARAVWMRVFERG